MTRRIRQITGIKTDRQWFEIWFHDGAQDPESYDECCKQYMLDAGDA